MLNPLFNVFLFLQFALALVFFITLFFITAPYGRHMQKGWGPTIQARFGWIIMEFPAFFMILFFYLLAVLGGNSAFSERTIVLLVFILLWELHYVQRTFVYPSIMAHGKKKNFPFTVALMGFSFNLLNGGVNGWYFYNILVSNNLDPEKYQASWLMDPRFIIGVMLFLAGLSINLYADRELRKLREKNKKEYSIPEGGLFELISSPNYFGEMLEWAGWAVLTWSLPGLAFAIFTFANLFPRAISNHKWYKKTFKNYPKERKAIIPFVL